MSEERKKHILNQLVKQIEAQLDEADLKEDVQLAISGTIMRIKDAPTNKTSVEDLQIKAGQGTYKSFAWSNNTESWPDENKHHLLSVEITKQSDKLEGEGSILMVSKIKKEEE